MLKKKGLLVVCLALLALLAVAGLSFSDEAAPAPEGGAPMANSTSVAPAPFAGHSTTGAQ